MKTIQITLDEELIAEVDREVKRLGTTRSALTREALRAILDKYHEMELEKKQVTGYVRKPVKPGEFSHWEDEQVWVD